MSKLIDATLFDREIQFIEIKKGHIQVWLESKNSRALIALIYQSLEGIEEAKLEHSFKILCNYTLLHFDRGIMDTKFASTLGAETYIKNLIDDLSFNKINILCQN